MMNFTGYDVMNATKSLSTWNVHYLLMTSRDELINKLMFNVKAKCADRLKAAQKTVSKPKLEHIEEFGISSIMKRRRDL